MASASAAAPDADADRMAVERFRQLIPELGGNYKGAHGKVAVVGGCAEFTGAPFFAAMSALRVGADMVYVICTASAATAIKSYSPELMVLPYLPEQPPGHEDGPVDAAAVERAVSRITPWLQRATTVVVGPGLGDDPAVCAVARALMGATRRLGLPLLVDGSALTHIVAQQADVVVGYRACVLTPNVAELGRIARAVGLELPGRMSDAWLVHAPQVAQAFKGPVVIAKGAVDLICAASEEVASPGLQQQEAPRASAGGAGAAAPCDPGPEPLLRCSEPGSLRRCGGQGDVLAGTAAAFLGWASKREARGASSETAAPPAEPASTSSSCGAPADPPDGSTAGGGGLSSDTVAVCSYMACKVVRGAAREAFAVGQRSMVAGDIIPFLYPALKRTTGRQ